MGQDISLGAELPAGSALVPSDGQQLGLSVERVARTLYLRLRGDFDLAGVGQVEAALERELEAQTTRVVLDLEQVAFIDVAGLRTILGANHRARSAAFDVLVVPPRGLASRIFTLTGAGTQLTLVDRFSQTVSHGQSQGWLA